MQGDTIDIIAKRFLKINIEEYINDELAAELSESMSEDGSWRDLDYEGEKVPFWRCIDHFKRLDCLAVSGKYDEKVIKGIEFWYKKERKDPNWWWNEIGLQIFFAPCAVFMRDKLNNELKKQVAESFNEYVADKWTGTNRFWLAQNVIVRGIVLENAELIERGKKYLEDTIYISEVGEEGIQPDFAFAMHGPQLYNNGYGRALILDACNWIGIFEGTEFAFSKEKTDIITGLLLDGSGHMCFGYVADYNTIGRDIVRSHSERDIRAKSYLGSIEILKKVSDRKDELLKLAEFINGNSRIFERTKMFSSLDIMTGVHNGGYASVRFGSDKVLGGDVIEGKIVNGEDTLSGFRSCFTTQYMVTGLEYDRIFPLWNWAFLPGVSCPEIELPTERGAIMKSTFAGGTSDGLNGVCAIDLKEDDSGDGETVVFGGKKACFFVGDEIIHLGCGLYSETNLNTTVNQCNFDKSFNVDGTEYGLESVEKSAKYILHGNIAYVFKDNTNVRVFAEHREGTWNRLTRLTETVRAEGDVFTAYVPQKNGDSYAYAVLLNRDEEYVKSYEFPETVNTEKVQAVKRGNLICVVFYEPCSAWVGDTEISADAPCFVIIKDGKIVTKSEM